MAKAKGKRRKLELLISQVSDIQVSLNKLVRQQDKLLKLLPQTVSKRRSTTSAPPKARNAPGQPKPTKQQKPVLVAKAHEGSGVQKVTG